MDSDRKGVKYTKWVFYSVLKTIWFKVKTLYYILTPKSKSLNLCIEPKYVKTSPFKDKHSNCKIAIIEHSIIDFFSYSSV